MLNVRVHFFVRQPTSLQVLSYVRQHDASPTHVRSTGGDQDRTSPARRGRANSSGWQEVRWSQLVGGPPLCQHRGLA